VGAAINEPTCLQQRSSGADRGSSSPLQKRRSENVADRRAVCATASKPCAISATGAVLSVPGARVAFWPGTSATWRSAVAGVRSTNVGSRCAPEVRRSALPCAARGALLQPWRC